MMIVVDTIVTTVMSVWKASSEELSRENLYGGWATLIVLFILLMLWQFSRFFLAYCSPSKSVLVSDSFRPMNSRSRISEFVTDADLKFLMENLDELFHENDKWEAVIDKSNKNLSYYAKCCKPKDGPLKYLSMTVFDEVSPEVLREFYLDSDYRKKWDKTVVEHEQLQVDKSSGIEVGRTIKKFPLLSPREYVLAWKLWEGRDKTFYCFIKECQHPLAPYHRKYVRVKFFRSGWRIRKVPGRNACEITMFHQEDAGLNTELAKLAFARGIWSYVCKMDDALRRYSSRSSSVTTSANLMQKVPTHLDTIHSNGAHPTILHEHVTDESRKKTLFKRPSGKFVANSLLLVGGAICLSRGHSSLGAKVALAYMLTKLGKHSAKSNPNEQHQGR
ncbi:uncharacterized protein LOC114718015 [Neltuma alba]|uniref:uncharacterized protein LOC114718015 n=1 Tax=Neltuma alba TaxID=207710 RepID=UPI0010A4C600|nr:uncharacterized protein LOC114718015 [Prosopis alba]